MFKVLHPVGFLWVLSGKHYSTTGRFLKDVTHSSIDITSWIVAMGLFYCKVDAIS